MSFIYFLRGRHAAKTHTKLIMLCLNWWGKWFRVRQPQILLQTKLNLLVLNHQVTDVANRKVTKQLDVMTSDLIEELWVPIPTEFGGWRRGGWMTSTKPRSDLWPFWTFTITHVRKYSAYLAALSPWGTSSDSVHVSSLPPEQNNRAEEPLLWGAPPYQIWGESSLPSVCINNWYSMLWSQLMFFQDDRNISG